MKPNPRNFYPEPFDAIPEASEKTIAHVNAVVHIIKNKGVNRTKGFLILGHRYRFALGAVPEEFCDFPGKTFLGWPIVWVLDDDTYINLAQ